MISKKERRKRLVEDFRKIAKVSGRNENEAVAFATNLPDEVLDYFETLGFNPEKKVKIESNLETKRE